MLLVPAVDLDLRTSASALLACLSAMLLVPAAACQPSGAALGLCCGRIELFAQSCFAGSDPDRQAPSQEWPAGDAFTLVRFSLPVMFFPFFYLPVTAAVCSDNPWKPPWPGVSGALWQLERSGGAMTFTVASSAQCCFEQVPSLTHRLTHECTNELRFSCALLTRRIVAPFAENGVQNHSSGPEKSGKDEALVRDYLASNSKLLLSQQKAGGMASIRVRLKGATD